MRRKKKIKRVLVAKALACACCIGATTEAWWPKLFHIPMASRFFSSSAFVSLVVRAPLLVGLGRFLFLPRASRAATGWTVRAHASTDIGPKHNTERHRF